MIQMHAKTNNQETIWWILKIFEGGLWLMLIYFFSELRSGIKCPIHMSGMFTRSLRPKPMRWWQICCIRHAIGLESLKRAKFLSEYPGRSKCPDNYYISMVLSLFCFPCMIAEMGECAESKNFSNQATNHDFNNIVWPLDLTRPSDVSTDDLHWGQWTSTCPRLK